MVQADDVQALIKEVRYLSDRLQIADVINAYCRGLDRLDSTILEGAYHPGAMDRHGPFMGDRDTFVPWAIELESGFPATHHSVTTHNCEIVGDTAWAESYCVFFVILPDKTTLGAGAARYIDELTRIDGRWAISKRVQTMDCSYEMPASSWLGAAWDELPPGRDKTDLSYDRPLAIPEPILKA